MNFFLPAFRLWDLSKDCDEDEEDEEQEVGLHGLHVESWDEEESDEEDKDSDSKSILCERGRELEYSDSIN